MYTGIAILDRCERKFLTVIGLYPDPDVNEPHEACLLKYVSTVIPRPVYPDLPRPTEPQKGVG